MPIEQIMRVTFNPNVQVRETLSIHHYTASEISSTWYDDDEMEKITQRCFKILRKFEVRNQDSPKYCMRGLECHTTSGAISRGSNRSAAFAAVLDEQARQWNENETYDAQAISDAYRQVASLCQMLAQVVGNMDQQAALPYQYGDKNNEKEKMFAASGRVQKKRRMTSCLKNESKKGSITASSVSAAVA